MIASKIQASKAAARTFGADHSRGKMIFVAILIAIFVDAEGPTRIGIKIGTRMGEVSGQVRPRPERSGRIIRGGN